MKKVFSIWSLAILMVMSVGFSSCSEDEGDDGDSRNDGVYNVTYEVSVISPCYISHVEYLESTGTNVGGNKSTTETGINARTVSKSVQINASSASDALSNGVARISGSVVTWQNGKGSIDDPKLSVKIYVNNELRVESSQFKRISEDGGTFNVSYTITEEDKPNKK